MQCKCSLHIFISIRQNTPRKYRTREGWATERYPIENGMCVITTRTVYIVMLVYLWLEIYRRNIGVQFANGKQMCASSVLQVCCCCLYWKSPNSLNISFFTWNHFRKFAFKKRKHISYTVNMKPGHKSATYGMLLHFQCVFNWSVGDLNGNFNPPHPSKNISTTHMHTG